MKMKQRPRGINNLIKIKEQAQGWQRETKMATVGRARQTAESLINLQLSRAVYGEASEKDIERRQRVFRTSAVREPDRSHARRDESTSDDNI